MQSPLSPPPDPFSYRKDDDLHHWMPIFLTTLILFGALVLWIKKCLNGQDRTVREISGFFGAVSLRDGQMGAILALSFYLIAAHIMFAARGFSTIVAACVAVTVLLFDFLTQEAHKINFKPLNAANVVMIVSIYYFITGYSDMLERAPDKGGFGDPASSGAFPIFHFISATLFALAFIYRTCCAHPINESQTLIEVGPGEFLFFALVALYALLQYLSVAMPTDKAVEMFRRDAISVMYFAWFAAISNAVYFLTQRRSSVQWFNLFWTVALLLAIVFTHLHIHNEYSTRDYDNFGTAQGFKTDVSNAEDENDTDNGFALKLLVLSFWGVVVATPFMNLYDNSSDKGANARSSANQAQSQTENGAGAMWKHV